MTETKSGLKVGDKVMTSFGPLSDTEGTVVAIATGGSMKVDLVKIKGTVKKGWWNQKLVEVEAWEVEVGVRKIIE